MKMETPFNNKVTVTKFSIGKSVNGSRSLIRLEQCKCHIVTLLPVRNRVVPSCFVRVGQKLARSLLDSFKDERHWIQTFLLY